jgi:hypothetical protein
MHRENKVPKDTFSGNVLNCQKQNSNFLTLHSYKYHVSTEQKKIYIIYKTYLLYLYKSKTYDSSNLIRGLRTMTRKIKIISPTKTYFLPLFLALYREGENRSNSEVRKGHPIKFK